ncbi:hypothetical protein AB7M16_000864 [Bradyrhizobium sp. USDA 372]
MIPIRSLGTEYFNYDEGRHALVGTRSGTMYQLGDVVDVRLIEAAPIAGALRFELLSSESDSGPRQRRPLRPQRKSSKAHPGRSPERKRKPEKQKSGKGKKAKAKNKGKGKKGKAW